MLKLRRAEFALRGYAPTMQATALFDNRDEEAAGLGGILYKRFQHKFLKRLARLKIVEGNEKVWTGDTSSGLKQ